MEEKKKIALFFKMDDEKQMRAYELLKKMDRKKSCVIASLIIEHEKEALSMYEMELSSYNVRAALKRKLKSGDDDKNKTKKKEEKLATDRVFKKKEENIIHKKEQVPIKEDGSCTKKECNDSLILKGLKMFGN